MIFTAKFEELDSEFSSKFEELDSDFSASLDENIVIELTTEHEQYEGDYNVTPTIESQTLPTKKKLMAEDVNIKGIPIFETDNLSGGTTVYIAKE